MSTDHLIIVSKEEEQERLDTFLTNRFEGFSRTYFQMLIKNNLVLVNGEPVKKRIKLEEGDEIEIEFALTEESKIEPENIALSILYEDDELIAINKAPGMVTHPAVGNWHGTFVNALLYHCQSLPEHHLRPGIVHRLDKETSGVLVAAKTTSMQQKLVALFASRQVKKKYVAICLGNPGNQVIEGRIGRHPIRRKEMAIIEGGGKEAITRVQTRFCDGKISVIDLYPQTGRTHQLRVHLKSIGCPILGDSVYGNKALNTKYGAQRQLLHAERLLLPLEKPLELVAPIPEDMLAYTLMVQ